MRISYLVKLKMTRLHCLATEIVKAKHGPTPVCIAVLFEPYIHRYNTRAKYHLNVPGVRTTSFDLYSLKYLGSKAWNDLCWTNSKQILVNVFVSSANVLSVISEVVILKG